MGNRWIVVFALVGLLAATLIGVAFWQAQQGPEVDDPPANSTAEGFGLVDGDGPVTVEIWLDFHCPFCQQFEAQAAPALDALVQDGEITRIQYPVAFLDRASTNDYSTRTSNAAACAADADAHSAYIEALLAAQPGEGEDGLPDDQLIEVGEQVGITDDGFAQCVRDQVYLDWTRAVSDHAGQQDVTGVPTVFVDGEQVSPSADAVLAAVRDAAG